MERAGHGDPLRRQLAGLWRAHRNQITVAVDRAERLGRVVAASRPRLVLCHADLHTANLLVGRWARPRGGRPWPSSGPVRTR
jgi:hypothetical protein